MAESASTESRPAALTRASVSPTHFSTITVDGIGLDAAIEHYLNWVEGRGHAAARRPSQGVPQPLPRRTLTANGGGTVNGTNGAEVASRRSEGEFALRFVHRDDKMPDVHWYSVVRVTEVEPERGATAAIRVEHASGRAMPPFRKLPPIAGAPAVLSRLLALPGARPRERDLATRDVVHVRAGGAENFIKYVLLDENRTLPVLLVSPVKDTGENLVDPSKLTQRLFAQVILATIDADATWEFAQAFRERDFDREIGVCFDGAARLYHPGLAREQNPREHYLWLPYRLQSFGAAATNRLAGEVAERVTWRALPPRFFSVLEDIDRARVRERAQNALQAKIVDVPDLSAKVASLEELVEELRKQLSASQEEHQLWEDEAGRYEKRLAESHQLLEIAEQELDEANNKRTVAEARVETLEDRAGGLSAKQTAALRSLADGHVGSLCDGLLLLEALYADRVTILSSAWSSAEESAAFKKPDKAWELLLRLATGYWKAVQNGGDSEGKKCFSDSTFAPRESETVEGRKRARERRTFRYKSEDVVMWKHLKIGNKDSITETWRCHFEFDADEKKVVIGHCGKHLNFK